jgi:NTE family protein
VTTTVTPPGRTPNGRWGLVLGGGGVLGGAWMVGALTAFEEVHGLDPRTADLLVGTSAGSVTAALFGAGVSVAELRAHQLGEPSRSGPLARIGWDYETATGGSLPPLPRWGLGSAGLVSQGASRLLQLPPTSVLSALMPEGRGSLEMVGRLVQSVQDEIGAPVGGWSPHPGVRAVAMDFESGRRVVFGDPVSPPASLAEAVMASCAVPGWYSPVTIHGVRYIDGGASSSTNIDVAAGQDLDQIFVLAPTVSFSTDNPRSGPARMERAWRERVTRRALREVAKVHVTGTDVTVLGPGPEDLEAMGFNLMDVNRRRRVLDTSLQTTRLALSDPEELEALLDTRVLDAQVLDSQVDEPRVDESAPGELPAKEVS